MADFGQLAWVEDATATSAANFNRMEAGIKDAAQDSKQRGPLNTRPAAAASTKNWFWIDSATGAVSYCDGASWHTISGGDYDKAPVVCSVTANVNLAAPGSSFTAGIPAVGERYLLVGQANATQNGIWVWNGAAVAMTRASDANLSAHFKAGALIPTKYANNRWNDGGMKWRYTGADNPNVGISNLTFELEPGSVVGGAAANRPAAAVLRGSTWISNDTQETWFSDPETGVWMSSAVPSLRHIQIPISDLPGPLPVTGNFTAAGRSCWAFIGITGMGSTAGFKTVEIALDGVVQALAGFYYNNANVHGAFPLRVVSLGAPAAGNHTITLQSTSLSTDANDRLTAVVVQA